MHSEDHQSMIYLLPGGQVGTFPSSPQKIVFRVTKRYIKIPIEMIIVTAKAVKTHSIQSNIMFIPMFPCCRMPPDKPFRMRANGFMKLWTTSRRCLDAALVNRSAVSVWSVVCMIQFSLIFYICIMYVYMYIYYTYIFICVYIYIFILYMYLFF